MPLSSSSSGQGLTDFIERADGLGIRQDHARAADHVRVPYDAVDVAVDEIAEDEGGHNQLQCSRYQFQHELARERLLISRLYLGLANHYRRLWREQFNSLLMRKRLRSCPYRIEDPNASSLTIAIGWLNRVGLRRPWPFGASRVCGALRIS